ncbi:MAG: prepilin-type N-terminal cleavage/methylation domain-containing protein [Candidatus Taylorbacteria bacterium]|nr:prepilin-type N-terminal cleavage/methylation domain-containing protein [Candidatus Taylorbacteria bacterium]
MNRRAFTLIELLVVISIISLLSSVVLSQLNAAREKGRLGAARHFAAQVEHTAGDLVVGMWSFDECAGLSTADRSGFGNNGVLQNMAGTSEWSSDTPSGTGCSLLLDGTNDYVSVPDSASLDLSGVATLSIWVKSSGTNAYSGFMNKTSALTGYQFGIGASNSIRGDLYNGTTYISPMHTTNVLDGKWHHIAVAYDGVAAKVYVDGIAGGAVAGSGFVTANNASFVIGNDVCCGGRFFNGRIDEARVFAKALTAKEVERIYASEKKGSQVAGI